MAIYGPRGRVSLGWPRWTPRAALITLIFGCLSVFSLHHALTQQDWDYYATPVGAHERVGLQDGSVLELNTDTDVKVRFTRGERQVVVTRGEASFDVEHDPTRPFCVYVSNARVQAVGTAFSVRLHANQRIDLTVTEGVVGVERVSPLERVLRGTTWSKPSADPTLVRAVRVVTDVGGKFSTSTPSREELAARQSWRTGKVALFGTPLAEAVEEFNRYNKSPRLVLADPAIAAFSAGGLFDTTDVEAFVSSLKQSGIGITRHTDASGVETVSLHQRDK